MSVQYPRFQSMNRHRSFLPHFSFVCYQRWQFLTWQERNKRKGGRRLFQIFRSNGGDYSREAINGGSNSRKSLIQIKYEKPPSVEIMFNDFDSLTTSVCWMFSNDGFLYILFHFSLVCYIKCLLVIHYWHLWESLPFRVPSSKFSSSVIINALLIFSVDVFNRITNYHGNIVLH